MQSQILFPLCMIDFYYYYFFFFFSLFHFFPRLHYPGTKRGVVSTTTEAYGGRNTAGVINNTDMFNHGMQHRLLQVEMEKRDVVFVEKSVWMLRCMDTKRVLLE